MSKEKQIEKMAEIIEEASCGYGIEGCHRCEFDRAKNISCAEMRIAKSLYNAGYRKQSEGEWIDADPKGHLYRFTCSLCKKTKLGKGTPFCPNCGAKMKGV